MALPSSAKARILTEISEWSRSPPVDIFLFVDEERLHTCSVLIVGPPDTPYAHGMYLFKMTYGPSYPIESMSCVCTSTASGTIRWNPNIYSEGKVCLSTLGTWEGEETEKWTAALTTQIISRAIQSLLHDRPYRNEPGYEELPNPDDKTLSLEYNKKIRHEALRAAVIQPLLDIFERKREGPLESLQKATFLNYYDIYLQRVESSAKEVSPGTPFAMMPFEGGDNGMSGMFRYDEVLRHLRRVKSLLDREEEKWVTEGRRITATGGVGSVAYEDLLRDMEELSSNPIAGVDASHADDNMFVWNAAVMPEDGHFGGGVFRVEIVIPTGDRTELPRVHFRTKIFHPNISQTDQRPFIMFGWPTRTPWTLHRVLTALLDIIRKEPHPDPIADLNEEAAVMWRSSSRREEYLRRARRLKEDSLEM